MEKDSTCNNNKKRAGEDILIPDKIDIKSKLLQGTKDYKRVNSSKRYNNYKYREYQKNVRTF